MLIFLGCVCIISLYIALQLEPDSPKTDRRYKTGYKNNATMPVKSDKRRGVQKWLILVGIVSGIIWYFVGGGEFIKGYF